MLVRTSGRNFLVLVLGLMMACLGLAQVQGLRFARYTNRSGFYDNAIRDLAVSGSSVWVASFYTVYKEGGDPFDVGGVSRFVPGQKATNFGADQIGTVYVNTIAVDGRQVWLGTPTGIKIYDTSDKTWTTIREGLPKPDVWAIAFQGDSVFVGTGGGLVVLKRTGEVSRTYTTDDGLRSNNVRSIAVDGQELWIATTNGVSNLDLVSGKMTSYGPEDGLADEQVLTVALDGNDVWAGTIQGASRLVRETGKWSPFPEDGEPSKAIVRDIVPTTEKVWLATSEGLAVLRKEDGKVTWYNTGSGLPSKNLLCMAKNGLLWIGTDSGLVAVKAGARIGILPIIAAVVAVAGIVGYVSWKRRRPTQAKAETEPERRRKPKAKAAPPDTICLGNPRRELCEKCTFNDLKGGRSYCTKHSKFCE